MANRMMVAAFGSLIGSIAVSALLSCIGPAPSGHSPDPRGAFAAWCSQPAPGQPGFSRGDQQAGATPEEWAAAGNVRVSFKQEIVPLLRQHCAACHTSTSSSGQAIEMFDARSEPRHAMIAANVGPMLLEIQTGRMPAGKPNSIPAEQFRALDVWAASGAPDN